MIKKTFALLLSIVMIFSICGCRKQSDTKITEPSTQPTEKQNVSYSVDGETTLYNISAILLSNETNKFEDMCFDEQYKEQVGDSFQYGTAFTLLLYANNDNINLNQIEQITVKSNNEKILNMNTKTYMLNNKQACIVFTKTEGKHNIDEILVEVKTYDKKIGNIPIQIKQDKSIVDKFCTSSKDAKFGDLISINDKIYFILQSGKLSSTTFKKQDKDYAEVLIGISLIPIENKYKSTLLRNNFSTQFIDTENLGDYEVKTELFVNDENLKEQYKQNFSGLFVELIICKFTIEINEKIGTEQTIARRDYVINNMWLKLAKEDDFLYKLYSNK